MKKVICFICLCAVAMVSGCKAGQDPTAPIAQACSKVHEVTAIVKDVCGIPEVAARGDVCAKALDALAKAEAFCSAFNPVTTTTLPVSTSTK